MDTRQNIISIDSPEYQDIKRKALLNDEQYLLTQFLKIEKWGGSQVRLINEANDLIMSAELDKPAETGVIIFEKRIWEMLDRFTR